MQGDAAPIQDAAEAIAAANPPAAEDASRSTVGTPLKSAVVFGLGTALQRGIAFLLLPVYTRALSPAQYGALSVLLALTSAASIMFAFGLDMGLFRSFFLYADQPERKRTFLGSIWRFLVFAPFTGAVLGGAIAAPFVVGIKRVTPIDVFLALLAGAFFVSATVVPLVVMRVERRLRDFMALSIVGAVVTPVLTLILVVWLNDGITGWLCAAAGSNAILFLASLRIVPWERGTSFDRVMVRRAVRFGGTLIPHAFALWALLLIDRGVLAGIVSAHQLGIYSLAANLGVPVGIAIQSLNQAMMPTYASAGVNPEQRGHLADLVVVQITGVLVLGLAGALLGGPTLLVLAAHSYDQAAPLVAWIVLGYVFLGLYFIPMNGITMGAGRSGFVWIVSALGAASNVALLFIFVPHHGILAAAIADAAAYLVLLVCISVYAYRPENPVRYRWAQILPLACAASAVYVAARLTTQDSGAASIAIRLTWTAGFAAACAVFIKTKTGTSPQTPVTAGLGVSGPR